MLNKDCDSELKRIIGDGYQQSDDQLKFPKMFLAIIVFL